MPSQIISQPRGKNFGQGLPRGHFVDCGSNKPLFFIESHKNVFVNNNNTFYSNIFHKNIHYELS